VDIDLKLLGPNDWHFVTTIELDPEQEDFAGGTIEKVLHGLRTGSHQDSRHPFAICLGDEIIGFLALREGPALPMWAYKNTMTLHSFRVTKSMQSRGYGTAALVLAARWIGANRPNVKHLMLTVNAENPQADVLYLRCGFRNTGTLFQGRIGKERVLVCDVTTLAGPSERPEKER